MTPTLVAIDPTSKKGKSFEGFCSLVRFFQQNGILTRTDIVSIIHASLYAIPYKWYRENKNQLATEALENITRDCQGRFAFGRAKVLLSNSSHNEDLVSQLSKFGQRKSYELLVVSSSDRAGLPYWVLGSFSETAALTAKIPLLVIKPHLTEKDFSKSPRFVLAVDTTMPFPKKYIRWLAKLAKQTEAHIDLINVKPLRRKSDPAPEKVLKEISQQLSAIGVSCKVTVLKEGKSVAHTIAEYSQKRKAWLTITLNSERSMTRRIFLGSTSRRLLTLTERPFLTL